VAETTLTFSRPIQAQVFLLQSAIRFLTGHWRGRGGFSRKRVGAGRAAHGSDE